MKASRLEMYVQQFIDNVVTEAQQSEEVGLGFDAMLGHDVVKFLTTDHNIAKPLLQRGGYQPDAVFALDEHELAMI